MLGHAEGPIPPGRYDRIREYVRSHAARTLHELSGYRIDLGVGSSGTIESLADVASRLPSGNGDASVLTYHGLQEAVRMLCALPLARRRETPGLTPARADIIIGGAAIIDVFMQSLGLKSISVSDRGVRDGLLVDYLIRHGKSDLFGVDVGLRERSVVQLGRACRFNEEHARTTADLALQLFDSAAEQGLHHMGSWERELLEYAALLHHIGSFLTYSGYQRHGHYLVRNADLLGFDQLEIGIMSLLVLYHRGALPRTSDHEFVTLEGPHQTAVRALSTFLRIAECLDRSQTRNVSRARLIAGKPDRIVLKLKAAGDCQVELSGLENQRSAIERVLGHRLEVRVNPADSKAQSTA
jgi:exopolyphosphatase/guanosine-5'-triphosphate,3'-diphosphate pyrophosphatase